MKVVRKVYSKEELIEAASAFHGHTGPYLVLGLKAGEVAERALGHDPFNVSCEVHCEPSPPQSCIVDGIQFSTSCTMGKGNIRMLNSDTLRIVFRKGPAAVEILPKEELIEMLKKAKGKESDELSDRLYEMPAEDIFNVKRI